MNKKVLFTIVPMTLLMGVITGCNNNGIVQYAVTFDTDGGSLISPVIVKKGEKVSRPSETPTKDGYTFTDWYTTKEGNETFDFGNAINQNTTIYAHYKSLTDEEKFYVAYKTASENFQTSEKGFDQYDITYKMGDATISNIEKVYYDTDEQNARRCSLKQIGSENPTILAGGENYKYYEDENKGIKAYIQSFKSAGYTVTFNTDGLYKTCSFTATYNGDSISSTFNRYGYLTEIKTSSADIDTEIKLTFSYSGLLHNPGKNVDAILSSGTYIASASNLAQRDLVRVTIDDNEIASNSFNTIECPDYTIGQYSFGSDIRLMAIYDANFSKLTGYTFDDGKITFTNARKAKTIVDLKVNKDEGIANLTINATKVS